MRRIMNSKDQRHQKQGEGRPNLDSTSSSSQSPSPQQSLSSSLFPRSDRGQRPGQGTLLTPAPATALAATSHSAGFPPTPPPQPISGIPRFGAIKAPIRSKPPTKKILQMETIICDGLPGVWAQFRDARELTDCTLRSTDGQTFPIHRAILASVSPYFLSFFTAPSQTLTKEGEPMPCPFDGETLRCILDFAYTGKAKITPDNVRKLLTVSNQLQMKIFMQSCVAFLKDSLCPENCLDVFKFCRNSYCPEVERKGREYILAHFKKVIGTPEFLDLEFLELEDLIRDDNLNLKNEKMVFDAIRQWVEHCPELRTSKLIELLQCVRFGLMSYRHFKTEVLMWEYVQNRPDILNSLDQASNFLAKLESHQGSELDLNDPLARPRIPYDIIFAVGGWCAGNPTSFMETYDSRANRWFLINGTDVTPRAYHGLVNLDNWIYMIGGFDGNEHFNTVQAFNPMTRTWQEKSCMNFPRCYVSCCVFDRYIYAMGGYNGRGRMNSAERYNVEKNQWDMIPSMHLQRSDASACVLNDKIYVAGGFNGIVALNSVEVYDPKISPEGAWTFILPMNSPRSGFAITAYRGLLYVFGGFNGFTRLASGETFNPLESTDWQAMPDMGSPRSNFATSVIDDKIFVIGGFNGTTTIDYVECYDGTTNEWFDVAHANLNRSAVSACVLSGLPNGREFSYLSRVQEFLGLPQPNHFTTAAPPASNSLALTSAPAPASASAPETPSN